MNETYRYKNNSNEYALSYTVSHVSHESHVKNGKNEYRFSLINLNVRNA